MDPPIALTRSISVDSLLLNMRTYRNTAMDLTGATNVPTQHADSESNATAPAGQVEADPDAETIPRGDVGTTNGHGTCKATIHDLPLEILDMVFDNLFGKLRPDIPNSKTGTGSLSTWDKCLRHSRRKWLTDLALVNIMWLVMVQRRIYRQLKVVATRNSMIEYGRWFRDRPRLRKYVRSVEVWFPVWAERVVTGDPPGQNPDDTHFGPHDHSFYLMPRTALISLQTLFSHIRAYHPHLAILALEGGSCKNGQLIRHFSEDGAFPWLNELYALYPRQLPTLPSVQTLIMRGSFNLARTWPQWHTLAAAFPNLQHWDCTYWPFGTHVYNLMREALKYPPEKLRHLTLSFDGLCGLGELSEVRDKSLCKKLARLAARLESLTFTGRICARFFTYLAVAYPSDVQEQRLRALNFNVETTCNDCRKVKEDPFVANPPVSGINNPDFICDFEAVTLGAITALKHVRTLQHLMIRTLTVNSRWVLLAPYFEFNGYRCKGFWSELIVESLASLRGGGITYLELSEGIERKVNKKGETVGYVPPTCRPVSLNKEAYKLLKS